MYSLVCAMPGFNLTCIGRKDCARRLSVRSRARALSVAAHVHTNTGGMQLCAGKAARSLGDSFLVMLSYHTSHVTRAQRPCSNIIVQHRVRAFSVPIKQC